MNTITAPSGAADQTQPIVCAAIAALRAITAELDALTADQQSPLASYQLSQMGVQAWLTGERGRRLLATLGKDDGTDMRVISTSPAGADESALAGLHQALDAIHRQLIELVDVSADGDPPVDVNGPESLLLFVHEVGDLSLELASHVR